MICSVPVGMVGLAIVAITVVSLSRFLTRRTLIDRDFLLAGPVISRYGLDPDREPTPQSRGMQPSVTLAAFLVPEARRAWCPGKLRNRTLLEISLFRKTVGTIWRRRAEVERNPKQSFKHLRGTLWNRQARKRALRNGNVPHCEPIPRLAFP